MSDFQSLISVDNDVRFGKPCITGTRIAVSDVLGWLASGMTNREILEDYPQLRLEHIMAALSFAANREALIKFLYVYAKPAA